MTNEEIKQKIEENIGKLEGKEFSFYFLTPDSKGNPTAAIANIYEHVKMLIELGYNAHILHQAKDYKLRADQEGNGVAEWLGEEYANLPHVCIQDQNLKVSPADFIIVPEIMGGVFKEIKNIPSKKILFMQAYNYLLEPYSAQEGFNFLSHGISSAITISERNKEYLESLTNGVTRTKIVPVGIPDYFTKSDKPRKPIIGIFSRDQRETLRFVKSFYTKYPQFKFMTFKELRGIPKEHFAKDISEMACIVWQDEISSFGTLPVEAMKCGVPVIGKVPDMVPEWMEDKNGYWSHSSNVLPDITYNFLQAWLEDNEPQDVYDNMKKIVEKYTLSQMKLEVERVYTEFINERIEEFKNNLPKEELTYNEQ
jgi:hypothetical protein